MTIKINPLQEAITEAEIARHTFCLASPGTDEEFTAFLSGFDAALGIFRNAIEKGGDASDQGNSDPRHDTSTGVTAGAVDPAAIWAEAWNAALKAAAKACDPSSYQAHHASVRRRCQTAILALIDKEQDDG